MKENILSFKNNILKRPKILVAGLIILIIIPLAIGFAANFFQKLPAGSKDEQTDFAHTSLAFSEEPKISSASGMYEMDIAINSRDNNVSGAKLELVFDPKVLGNVDIKPGSFLPNPTVISKKIDAVNGRITYVLESADGVKGEGTVAVISFSKLTNQETTINFLPQTQVSAQGFDQSVLKETVSGIIEAIPSPINTPESVSPEISQQPKQ